MKIKENCWNVTLLTLFEELFPGPLGYSITGRALKEEKWNLNTVNLRDFAMDKHKTVDDTPFGGGAGMVMRPDIIGKSIESVKERHDVDSIIYMSPRGERLTQEICEEISTQNHTMILCGRFEGIDQRAIDKHSMREISIGDYVLSGGDIAAIALMDACIRLLPGVVDRESLLEESFATSGDFKGLLEYPHYTKPAVWEGMEVPEILTSGHHKKIHDWRLKQSLKLTKARNK